MANSKKEKAMLSERINCYFQLNPVNGDIISLTEGKVVMKGKDRRPDSPPLVDAYTGQTIDPWTFEFLSQEDIDWERKCRARWEAKILREAAEETAATKATDTPNEDEIIEANTDGEFTAEDIEEAL